MKTQIVAVNQLTPLIIDRMFEIMRTYYVNFSRAQFEKDLFKKNDVILLLDSKNPNSSLVGFSTILLQNKTTPTGKKYIALYSGDTVLDKAYWGNRALATAFGRYIFKVKFKNLLTPTFWFLISKGYKTYLLMANNFPTHFPRFEKATPQKYEEIMNSFYQEMFDQQYDPKSHLMTPIGEACALKVSIADIDEKLLKIPRVHYFANHNPQWQNGIELCCIARVNFWVPIRYFFKRLVYKRGQK